jgi:hypothetical protein
MTDKEQYIADQGRKIVEDVMVETENENDGRVMFAILMGAMGLFLMSVDEDKRIDLLDRLDESSSYLRHDFPKEKD